MIPKVKLLFITAALLLFVQGCWGARETDEMGYILMMGIDKGRENIIKVTFQLAVPQPIGGGEEKVATEIIEVEAASIFGAQQLISAFVSKHLTLIHNTAVVVSEEIAREGLSKYINPLVRSRELRRTTFLLVAKGKAGEFIEKNKGLVFEKYPSRQLDILMASADLTGFILNSDIHRFYKGLKSPGQQPTAALVSVQKNKEEQNEEASNRSNKEKTIDEIAYLPGEIPRKGGNKIDLIGQAVFKEDQLVGFLNGKETRYYQMLTGEFETSVFSFPEPEDPEENLIVMEIKRGRHPKIRVKTNENKTVIEVTLFLEGEILSIQSGKNYEEGKLGKELENYINALISEEVTQLIKKTQEEYASDIFGFGEYTRVFFGTWQDWVNYAWLEKYPQCAVEVRTFFNIRRTGMMLKTAPTHY